MTSPSNLRAFSFGGGVQSMAALVLAAQGKIDFPTFLFSNVGEDSENPETLSYFRQIAVPYAEQHGVTLHELRKPRRGGGDDTLLDNVLRVQRSVPIPVRMASGAPGRRNCTTTFKVRVIANWLKHHGATPEQPAVLGLGISMDEFQRMRTHSGFDHYTLDYPLIAERLRREDCQRIIRDAGLDVPPKSSCWFCPFHKVGDWVEMRRHQPALFQKSVELESLLNRRRDTLGKDHVFLCNRRKPLDEAIPADATDAVEADGGCESGYCGL